jgi:hypothetical protein
VLTIIMMTCVIIILVDSVLKWRKVLWGAAAGRVTVTR